MRSEADDLRSVAVFGNPSGYRFAGVISRGFFFWSWAIIQLPGMKKIASGVCLTETKSVIMATTMAASFASRRLPR